MLDKRISKVFQEQNGFSLESSLVVLARIGSHSHGTYIPSAIDDVDYMGFFVAPIEYHLGLKRKEHWTLKIDELDVVLYSLEKATRLLLVGNPNIVGMLWLRDEDYVWHSPSFEYLRANRSLFSGKHVANAFYGYSYGQYKRMEAFDLESQELYERLAQEFEQYLPLQDVIDADKNKQVWIADNTPISRDKLNEFLKLHKQSFQGYMGRKRKELVKSFGFDCKNASHTVRLLRMGIEYMQTGQLQVFRTHDAEELKAIKRGEWSLAQVKTEIDRLFKELDKAKAESSLPDGANHACVDRILVAIHMDMLGMERH